MAMHCEVDIRKRWMLATGDLLYVLGVLLLILIDFRAPFSPVVTCSDFSHVAPGA